MAVKKLRTFLDRHGARLLFLLLLVCVGFAVRHAAKNTALEDTKLTHIQPTVLTEGWSALTADGEIPLAEPSRPAADCLTGRLRLKNTLPEPLPGNLSLCVQTKNESVRIWVDGALVYTYGEVPQLSYGQGVGVIWNLAALPEDAGGKTVIVELTPVARWTGRAPYEFLLGSHDGIVSYLLLEHTGLLAVCILMALIGLGALFMSAVGAFQRTPWADTAFNFSLFVLLAAVWTATDGGLLQFVLQKKSVSYLLFGGSFYMLGTPFALFIAGMLPERGRLFRALATINAVYALMRIALYVTGRLDFETGLWTLHLLMAVLILITNLAIWLPALRKKTIVRRELSLAVTAFTLVSIVSLVSFYANDKLNVQRNDYSSGYYVGILLFVVIIVAGFVRQMQVVRQQAFKAEFFERRAYTDELAGLLNVKGFDDKCAECLRDAPAGICYALVDFDVNFFSQYNANNGLEAGDALLQGIAAILQAGCHPGELCARQEADHFICLLRGDTLEAILARIAEADHTAKEQAAARMLLLSYGVAAVTDRSLSPAALRNQAVVAKRTVKGNYEKNIAVYDQRLHELQLQEMALLAGLEAALEHDEFVIFLQPKIDINTEKVVGAEALVRRIGADGTIMPAGPIVEALERKGFVAKLDFHVLEQVCRLLRRCLAENRTVYPISSNFSRVHLYDEGFPARVAETVDRHGIPRALVEIELTETAFLAGKDVLRDMVQRLHAYGFRVAIDDFGSGYSSLNMLKDVAVDVIKLDREFLADSAEDRRAGVIIGHTIRLAQKIGITCIAEGVETAEQLAFLRRLGCGLVQGYYYSLPLPEDAFIARYLPLEV